MTSNSTLSYIGTWIFNSHPHKEDDDGQHVTSNLDQIFSTHILTRRMTMPLREAMARSVFQLTSSQGGWRSSLCDLHGWICHFQLTSSQGGWRSISTLFRHHILFNSHPHKEDDWCRAGNWWSNFFSTHILTRRMTLLHGKVGVAGWFSTHILTRRMTTLEYDESETSAFQLTSSQGGWRRTAISYVEVRNFQLTSSQGGWRIHCRYFCSCNHFSTHILTRRMTYKIPDGEDGVSFQLTSSQGGWPPPCYFIKWEDLFNSHPHKEDDSNFKQKHSV